MPLRWSGRTANAAFVAALASACTRNGAPCAAPDCGSGYECLANTCSPVGSEPVPKDTTRVVLEPASVAGASGSETTGGTVDLGKDWAALYLRFDDSWRRDGSVVRAFLLLEAADDGEPGSEDLTLDVWAIEGPWTPSRIAVGARPNLGRPHARGLLRTSPRTLSRIDVTRVVRALAEGREDNGVAVIAGEPRRKTAVRTGSTGGAPRLELYIRR